MGEVAAKLKIMPESTDVDLGQLRQVLTKAIPEGGRLHAFAEEPVAFGLKALMMAVILREDVSGTDELEAALANVKGVQSVEVTELGLL
ncbi:MAG: elongation factor 1-beta [Methanotrichaceae archaeon]